MAITLGERTAIPLKYTLKRQISQKSSKCYRRRQKQ